MLADSPQVMDLQRLPTDLMLSSMLTSIGSSGVSLKSTGVAGGEAEFSVTGTVEPVH